MADFWHSPTGELTPEQEDDRKCRTWAATLRDVLRRRENALAHTTDPWQREHTLKDIANLRLALAKATADV